MRIYRALLTVSFLLAIVFTAPAAAQFYPAKGIVNGWTNKPVSRGKKYENTEFVKVKVGKHSGYDRVVFEFKYDLPNYTVNYVEPPIWLGESGEKVKISGKAFVEVAFYAVPIPENGDFPDELLEFPKEKLSLPIVNEIKMSNWWEGVLSLAVGLKAKKLYRVSELSDPARLVVDFKQ
ncbi:MAG TPA: hypothetical protein VF599_23255 [Pyrinomonadaceae bacterium]|jgi:hypothetical protein